MGFVGGGGEEGFLLGALLGDAGDLGTGLLDFRSVGGEAGFELGDAVVVVALAGGGTLELDGGGVGLGLGLLAFGFEGVAAGC